MNRPEENSTSSPAKKLRKRANSGVGRYLTILFIAAFLLLLLAFLMQMRSSEATIGSLKESLSSFESLNDLVLENQNLHDEIDQLEDAYETLENGNAELEDQLAAAKQESEAHLQVIQSWEAVYQMDILYRSEDYEACAQQARTILNSNTLRIPEAARPRFEEIATSLQEMELLSDWEF